MLGNSLNQGSSSSSTQDTSSFKSREASRLKNGSSHFLSPFLIILNQFISFNLLYSLILLKYNSQIHRWRARTLSSLGTQPSALQSAMPTFGSGRTKAQVHVASAPFFFYFRFSHKCLSWALHRKILFVCRGVRVGDGLGHFATRWLLGTRKKAAVQNILLRRHLLLWFELRACVA